VTPPAGREDGEHVRDDLVGLALEGPHPPHLVFDSQLTTYRKLAELNALGVIFITLRRRSPALLREMTLEPRSAWRTVQLDVPHQLYQTPKVIDQRVRLRAYGKDPLRQLFIKDLGHEQPTVLLTNDFRATPSALIIRYARRMLIENGLADAVNFLHLDALSSVVALNVSNGRPGWVRTRWGLDCVASRCAEQPSG
jgi:hypothetical protein